MTKMRILCGTILALQRLSYGPKHPPAEVYLDLPKPKPIKKGTGKWCAKQNLAGLVE